MPTIALCQDHLMVLEKEKKLAVVLVVVTTSKAFDTILEAHSLVAKGVKLPTLQQSVQHVRNY